MGKMTSIRNKSSIHRTAYLISQEINRGQATIDRIETVFSQFHEETGARNIAKITTDQISRFVKILQQRVDNGSLSRKTTASYVSALNTALSYAERSDLTVSAEKNGLSQGTTVPVNKANENQSTRELLSFLKFKAEKTTNNTNYLALRHSVRLQAEMGLRFRESVRISRSTIDRALETGTLHLSGRRDGTKNSRIRDIRLSPDQIFTLTAVKNFMITNHRQNLIDPQKTYEQYRNWAYRELKKFKISSNSYNQYHFHGNRHQEAHQRYSSLWQEKTGVAVQPPVKIGKSGKDWHEYAAAKTGLEIAALKKIDVEIRLKVSSELGHGRINITRDYLG